MFLPLDGPSLQDSLSVTNTVVQEIKSGVSAYDGRQVVTFQPLDDSVYIYFGDGQTTPSAATVQADGFYFTQNGIYTVEATYRQPVFVVAANSTADLRFAERS